MKKYREQQDMKNSGNNNYEPLQVWLRNFHGGEFIREGGGGRGGLRKS
jgi:hypothetical protein